MKAINYSLWLLLYLFFFSSAVFAQKKLTHRDLIPYTTHFSLSDQMEIEGEAARILVHEIQNNQFIGLGELHQSQLLGHFTSGLLRLLQKHGFKHFALEVGPYSAQTLTEASSMPEKTTGNIQAINKRYGNKLFRISPMVFADSKEDALFIEKAAELGFEFWGLDQEFFDSFEMHLDAIYALAAEKSPQLDGLYKHCISNVKKWRRKEIFSRNFTYTCTLNRDPDIQHFFNFFKGNKLAEDRIRALKISWDIYCKNEQGKGSNQLRAEYMKSNFDSLYKKALTQESSPKVFVKMGSVHLSRGISVFKVDDMGKYLVEKSEKLNTGFLTIRHLRRYRNGKDLIGTKGWESVGLLMKLGKKEEWTLTDLRPMRKKLQAGEIKADKSITYELNNYDFLLIPPNDKRTKVNF